MQPDEAARLSAEGIGMVPAGFMLDGATYERGGELGFDGFDFYTAGRGGPLGDVDGRVVAATFVFFNHPHIVDSWERGLKVSSPFESAGAFAACGYAWAGTHLADGPDYGRLAELSGRVVEGADIACAPLFVAWAAVPEPDEPKALALHRLNLLREFRNALHGASVLASGLTPIEALAVKTPYMATIFGWTDPLPDAPSCRDRWEEAERATDRAVGRAIAVLAPTERAEFAELVQAAHAAVG